MQTWKSAQLYTLFVKQSTSMTQYHLFWSHSHKTHLHVKLILKLDFIGIVLVFPAVFNIFEKYCAYYGFCSHKKSKFQTKGQIILVKHSSLLKQKKWGWDIHFSTSELLWRSEWFEEQIRENNENKVLLFCYFSVRM